MDAYSDTRELRLLGRNLKDTKARIQAGARLIVRKTTLDGERIAKQLAPVDTGNLRNSITSTIYSTPFGDFGEWGPTADYGAHVEFGAFNRWANRKLPPQPYTIPSHDAVAGPFVAAIEFLVSDQIEKAVSL